MAWLGIWKKRKSIAIDHLKIDADLTYFPVAVIIDGDTDFFGELTSDTDKLKVAFTKSDGETQLYFDCEHFDASNQKAVYHTSKSDWTISSASDTVFYIYYDSAQSDNTTYGNTTGNSPATNVWDSNFVLVHHMSESSGQLQDATANNRDTVAVGGSPTYGAEGKVGKCIDFEKSNGDYFQLATDFGFNGLSDFTLEAIVNPESHATSGNPQKILGLDNSTGNVAFGQRGHSPNYEGIEFTQWDTGGTEKILCTTDDIPLNTWTYVVGVYDYGTGRKIYWNEAVEKASDTWTGQFKSDGLNSYIGSWISLAQYWDGKIDEIRISNVARSTAWIKATYHSLFNTLVTFGTEESITTVSITDSGSGVDTISVTPFISISVADSGSGVDTISKLVTTLISVSDSGSGVETISTSISLTLQDSASGVDSVVLSKQVVLQDSASSVETISKRITYQRLVYDYEDFARPVSLVSYKTSSETLWENKDVVAGEVTDIIDVSTIASLGVYIAVSSATTIKFQVYTADGWKDYDELVFSGAGHIFLNFWTLPFQKIRFQTTQSTTATIEVFYRT